MSEPRAWVRPDGTLYVRDPHRRYGADVTWLAADAPAPEGAVPLVAAPDVDGDDPKGSRLLPPDAVNAIRAALAGALVRCRFHGDDFGRSNFERGLPRCESCQQPYRVQRARNALALAKPPKVRLDAATPVAREDTASPHEDEWVQDWSRSEHLVYECNLDHWCSMCGDPASHKVGEESPARPPENATDPMIAAGHNLTNWLCCLHFRVAVGDCGDRRSGPDGISHRYDGAPPETTEAPDAQPPSKLRQRRYDETSHVADVILEAYGHGEEVLAGVDMQSLRIATAIVDYLDANPAPTSPDAQPAAPTRDALADDEDDEQPHSWIELADEFKGTAQGAEEHSRRQEKETGRADLYALGRASGRSEAEARIRFMAGRLGSSADTQAIVARLATAAGVSPDSEDVVGAIEAAIRAGREPEVVTGAEAAELPPDSRVVRVIDRDSNLPEHLASVIKVGMGDLAPYGAVSYRVLYRAPAPTPAPLTVGEIVTGDRAVSAPIGTTLGAKSAAVAAVHTVNGWSVTGMGREQDHDGHVRVNEWVVLALGDGGETRG